MKIEKTFILHLETLSDRKKYIDANIKEKFGFDNVEFILSNSYTDSLILQKNDYVFDSMSWRGNHRLSNSEICNFHVHKLCWEKMVSENIATALIVEDDFLFKENHNLIFSDLIDNVPSDYSCCFFSECCGNTLHCYGNSKYEEKINTRCTTAYLINIDTCKKLLSVQNFSLPVDHHLNFVKNNLNLKYYWSNPIVFGQGSGQIYSSMFR